jgi:hypothetical protein
MNALEIENKVMERVIEAIEALDLDEFIKDEVIHAIARGDDK